MNSVIVPEATAEAATSTGIRILERLSENSTCLPLDSLRLTTSLIKLDLSNNCLKDLPSSLKLLENLNHLILSRNQFSRLPNVVGELRNLKSLDAQGNNIKEIPDSIGGLTYLESLNLNSNCLTKIPDCIASGMSNLRMLRVSSNANCDISIAPNSTKLVVFHGRRNGVCPFFPEWILSTRFTQLEEVSLNFTKFQKFNLPENPPASNIRRLHMKQCHVSHVIIRKIIAGLENLETLIIANENLARKGNIFWTVPVQGLRNSSNLRELDLTATGISMLPHMKDFLHLSVLNLSANSITWLPDDICSLSHLESLIINNNTLAILPENIGELKSLREFNASDNNLSEMPDSMKSMENLRYLDLYNNEMSSMPEVLTEVKSLIGLDLEKNYFDTANLWINETDYETMKSAAREYWKEQRIDGLKTEFLSGVEEISTASSDEEVSKFTGSSEPNEETNLKWDHRENWDVSEDSADEFDPNDNKQPKLRTYPPFTFFKPDERVFCPANFHQGRMATKISRMLQDGILTWPSEFEEGQFDDP